MSGDNGDIGTTITGNVPQRAHSEPQPLNKVFCHSNKLLNQELQQLHMQLAHGNSTAQLEIDRRIYACQLLEDGCSNNQVLQHIPYTWFFVSVTDVIRYERLPDVLRFITKAIIRKCWTTNIFTKLAHNAIPSFKTGRLLTNIFADLSTSHAVSCLNILHGTLLGLFPNCVKKPTFFVRKQLMVALHTLMTSTLEEQHKFLEQHQALLKLCYLEYIVNCMHDFCPSELLFYEQNRGMKQYYKVCTNVCDLFRMEMLQGTGCDWNSITLHAHTMFERFARSCKFRIQKNSNAISNVELNRRTLQAWRKEIGKDTNNQLFLQTLQDAGNMYFSPLQGTLNRIHNQRPDASALQQSKSSAVTLPTKHSLMSNVSGQFNVCDIPIQQTTEQQKTNFAVIEAIQDHMQCYFLPGNLFTEMLMHVSRMYATDSQTAFHATKLNICSWCVCKPGYDVVKPKLRLSIETNQLSCTMCEGNATIYKVNILGRLLRIGCDYYYFCLHCMQVHKWGSLGSEFVGSMCAMHAKSKIAKQTENKGRIAHTDTPETGTRGQNKGDTGPVEENPSMRRFIPRSKFALMDLLQTTHVGIRPVANSATCSTQQSMQHSTDQWMLKPTLHTRCLICCKRNVCHYVNTLHIPVLSFVTIYFCVKHRIPEHLHRYIYDTSSLKIIIKCGQYCYL